MKKILKVTLAVVMVVSMLLAVTGCGKEEKKEAKPGEGKTIILATTTSTKDSGLLDEIVPAFTEETGYEVKVVAVGSGEALEMGRQGEADVLLVHSPADEKTFVEEGNADKTGRKEVMYNDFVLVGPEADPAKVKENASEDAVKALTAISTSQSTFISRGDESGTHKKELSIWKAAGITPSGEWYVSAADGMGAVITMANEKQGYTLSDRATWLTVGKDTDLSIVCEKDPSGVLNNQYSVIGVNPDKNDKINNDGAKAFQDFLLSKDGQKLIGEFGKEQYGQQLFVPNAK